MKRKRKAVLPLGWLLSGLIVLAACAIAVVALEQRNDALGARLKALERREKELSRKVANEERNWTLACTVGNMDRLLAAQGLAMGYPKEANIVRLGEWPEEGRGGK